MMVVEEVEFEFSRSELNTQWDMRQRALTKFMSKDRKVVIELGFSQLELVVWDYCLFSVETRKAGPHLFRIQDLIDMINAATPVHQIHIKVTELE